MFIKTIEEEHSFPLNLPLVLWTCNMRIVPILVFGIFICEGHGFILDEKKQKGRSMTSWNDFFVWVTRNVNFDIYPDLHRNLKCSSRPFLLLSDLYIKHFLIYCDYVVMMWVKHHVECSWIHNITRRLWTKRGYRMVNVLVENVYFKIFFTQNIQSKYTVET